MSKLFSAFVAVLFVAISFNAQAADKKSTAENMVKAAITHYDKVGEETAYADFATPDSDFKHGEFYVFIQAADSGDMVFHGVNPKLVGKNLLKLKDTDKKLFVQELYDNTNKNGSTWTEYKWVHPETKKIAQKVVYSELHNGLIFSIGYYS
jgi:cytochrome c